MLAIKAHKKLVKTEADSYLILRDTIKVIAFRNYVINLVEEALANEKTHELSK